MKNLKHIKTFEQFDIRYSEYDSVNEELFGGMSDYIKKFDNAIKGVQVQGGNVSQGIKDNIKEIFSKIFSKAGGSTTISVNHWKQIRDNYFEKDLIPFDKMVSLIKELKEDFEDNKDYGYLVITTKDGEKIIVYKKAQFKKTSVGKTPAA